MKSLLLQIAGVLPLSILAVWSCVDLARRGAADAPTVDAADTDGVQEAWERARAECAAAEDLDLARRIAETDFLADGGAELAAASETKLKELVEAVRNTGAAREFATRSWRALERAKQDADSRSTPLEKTKAELERLDEFTRSQRDPMLGVDKIAGADDALRAIERQCETLRARRDELAAAESMDKALQAATDCVNFRPRPVDPKYFQELVEWSNKLQKEPFTSVVDPMKHKQINELVRRAKYKSDWYETFEYKNVTGKTLALEQQVEWARTFVDSHTPPTRHEEKAQERAEKIRDGLNIDLDIQNFRKSLSEKRLETAEKLFAGAAPIFRNPLLTAEQRETGRELVLTWMSHTGLPELKAPTGLTEYKEAIWTPKAAPAPAAVPAGLARTSRPAAAPTPSRPRRLIGEISRQAGENSTKRWRYRPWGKSAEIPLERGQEFFALDELESPDDPMYVKLAKRYGSARERPIERDATRDDWELAVQELNELRQELANYRARWVTTEPNRWDEDWREWSFEPALATAREVLDQWDLYEQIMRR